MCFEFGLFCFGFWVFFLLCFVSGLLFLVLVEKLHENKVSAVG